MDKVWAVASFSLDDNEKKDILTNIWSFVNYFSPLFDFSFLFILVLGLDECFWHKSVPYGPTQPLDT